MSVDQYLNFKLKDIHVHEEEKFPHMVDFFFVGGGGGGGCVRCFFLFVLFFFILFIGL